MALTSPEAGLSVQRKRWSAPSSFFSAASSSLGAKALSPLLRLLRFAPGRFPCDAPLWRLLIAACKSAIDIVGKDRAAEQSARASLTLSGTQASAASASPAA